MLKNSPIKKDVQDAFFTKIIGIEYPFVLQIANSPVK